MKKLLTPIFWFALLFALMPREARCCTSWMVFSDLTGNNTNILHKNRDSNNRKIVVAMSKEGGKRKWIALGSGGTNSGINSSGLAAAMNSGEMCVDPPVAKNGKRTVEILRHILESCDNAAQAVAELKKFITSGNYYHGKRGSIFFFIDKNEGYICEFTAKVCSVQRYERGYAARANVWLNPGMSQYARSDVGFFLSSSIRKYSTISGLNRMIEEHGKVTLWENFKLSRHSKMAKPSPLERSVCGNNTNSASTLVIDREYPDVLSSAYVTIGHPRHTVYVPIPICAKKIPAVMRTHGWSAASFKRLEKLKLDAPIPESWIKFEKESMASYAAAQAKARKLLAENKRDEAVRLLNSCAIKIWHNAVKVLKLK